MAGEDPSNPYAPPVDAGGATQGVPRAVASGGHYRMSPNKLALMSLVTLGVYDLAFFWRHWRAVRDSGQDVSVFFRTLFGVLYCFSLTRRIENGFNMAGLRAPAALRWAATLYLSLALIARLADVGDALSPAQLFMVSAGRTIASVYPLMTIQAAANQLLDARGDTTAENDGVRPATLLVTLLGLMLWGLMLIGSFADPSYYQPNLAPVPTSDPT